MALIIWETILDKQSNNDGIDYTVSPSMLLYVFIRDQRTISHILYDIEAKTCIAIHREFVWLYMYYQLIDPKSNHLMVTF